jgi:hypothetical protein
MRVFDQQKISKGLPELTFDILKASHALSYLEPLAAMPREFESVPRTVVERLETLAMSWRARSKDARKEPCPSFRAVIGTDCEEPQDLDWSAQATEEVGIR